MPDQSSITLDIPDTDLCREAWRYAQTIEATALANHSIRAFYFGRATGQTIAETIIDQAVAKPSKAVPGTFPADLVYRMRPSVGLPSWDDMFATSAWQGIA